MSHNEIRIKPKSSIQHNLVEMLSAKFLYVRGRMMRTFPFAAPMTVGSQRLSLESISKNTTSCSSNNFSSVATSCLVCATEAGGIGCPGMGILKLYPEES